MGPTTPLQDESHRDRTVTALEVAGLVAAAVVLVLFRRHAFDLPLETDECNYAYIGARLLTGDLLYVDVWDHQPFGVFTLFASVIAVFGDDPLVFRWLAVMFSGASLLLVHAIVRRGVGKSAAFVAAILFALVSSDPGTAGEGCNREIFMNTFVLAAWYLALIGCKRRYWLVGGAGNVAGHRLEPQDRRGGALGAPVCLDRGGGMA